MFINTLSLQKSILTSNSISRSTVTMKIHHKIILSSVIALSLPFSVEAGVVYRVNGNVIVYNDGGLLDNSQNDVTAGFDNNGHFIVSDAGDKVDVGSGCNRITQKSADCGATAVAKVIMDLGGGDDQAVPRVLESAIPMEINGGNGSDTLAGAFGKDILRGGNGNDTLYGSRGNDTIYGDDGSDLITGSVGHDKLYGGSGNDVINGNGENDIIHGDFGNDKITGGPGNDKMYGDFDNDTILANDNEHDVVDCGTFPFGEFDQANIDDGLLDTVTNCELWN